MGHRFKLHYLKIISRDWNMKKVANFHFKTPFFMNQKEKPRRLIHYHAQILLSFRIDFEISMAYWFIKRELSQIENI